MNTVLEVVHCLVFPQVQCTSETGFASVILYERSQALGAFINSVIGTE